MKNLEQLTFKTLEKPALVDPIQRRRDKIIAAIEQQMQVLTAAIKGVTFTVPAKVEGKAPKVVKPWFVTGDGGVYVLCKYGARTLLLSEQGNAVYVAKLADVSAVLTAFAAAAKSGELDAAMANAATKPTKKKA